MMDGLDYKSTSSSKHKDEKLIEKSVIVHQDQNGFGLRLIGQSPVVVEHVHKNGASRKAGVKKYDQINRINGLPVSFLDHQDVVLLFRNSLRFVNLTLLSRQDTGNADNDDYDDDYNDDRYINFKLKKSPLESDLTTYQYSGTADLKQNADTLYDFCRNSPSQSQSVKQIIYDRPTGRSSTKRSESVRSISKTNSDLDTLIKQSNDTLSMQRATFKMKKYDSLKTNSTIYCVTCQTLLKNSNDYFCFNCNAAIDAQQTNRCTCTTTNSPYFTKSPALQNKNYLKNSSNFIACKDNRNLSNSKRSQKGSTGPELPYELNKNAAVSSPKIKITTNKRLEIIKELITTEKTHTEKLKTLNEMFYKPLKNGKLMSHDQLKIIFSCHRELYNIHKQIFKTLMSSNSFIGNDLLIGEALAQIFNGDLRKRLDRAACLFCSCQATNVEVLNHLTRKDTKVGQFIVGVLNQQMTGRLGIKDLLAACFQRLTKYPLFFENLLKSTPTSVSLRHESEQHFHDHNETYEKFAEERQSIARALNQSREILLHVNEAVQQAIAYHKFKDIWRKTEKQPGVPSVDITNQHIYHEGSLILRLSKRSFDVHVLLLTDYLIILSKEGQDKYRFKFFSPDGKSASSQRIYSPIFVIDEHLTTRDAATDENGFYLLCKRKDDSRIYEFACRSPADKTKWRERIQWIVDKQINKSSSDSDRRLSSISLITKSSSEVSYKPDLDSISQKLEVARQKNVSLCKEDTENRSDIDRNNLDPRIEGTISYVEDDGIVIPTYLNYSVVKLREAKHICDFKEVPFSYECTPTNLNSRLIQDHSSLIEKLIGS